MGCRRIQCTPVGRSDANQNSLKLLAVDIKKDADALTKLQRDLQADRQVWQPKLTELDERCGVSDGQITHLDNRYLALDENLRILADYANQDLIKYIDAVEVLAERALRRIKLVDDSLRSTVTT